MQHLYTLNSSDFSTLYDLSQKQFAHYLGLSLNSKDWKAYIEPGKARFYNFLLNGVIKTTTETTINNHKYRQIIQFSDYKKLENMLLLLFMNDVPEKEIINFMATFLFNTTVKVRCNCPAFQFFGYEYILTKMESIYGRGENRPPVEKNRFQEGVFCKHLWIIAESLNKKNIQLAERLVPFYKRCFGISSRKNLEKLKNSLSPIFLVKIFEKAKKDVDKTNKNAVKNEFETIASKYLTDINAKKIKVPEVKDQKENDTKEIDRKLNEGKTVLDDLKEEGNDGNVQRIEE